MPTLRQGAGKSAGTGASPIGARCSPKTTGTGQESADGREEVALHFDRLYFCSCLFVSTCDTVFCRRSFSSAKRSHRTDSASDMVWLWGGVFCCIVIQNQKKYKSLLSCCGNRRKSQGLGYSCGCWEVFFSLWLLRLHRLSLLMEVQSFLERLVFLLRFLEYG